MRSSSIAQAVIALARDSQTSQPELLDQLTAWLSSPEMQSLTPAVLSDISRYSEGQTAETCQVTTAAPLTPEQQQEIASIFAVTPESILVTVDEDIIGGMRILYRNQLWDMSLRTGLHQLRRAFTETA